MLQINKDQTGGELEIERGESFEVELPENPTTGYRWHPRSSGAPLLELEDDSFHASGGLYGAGGLRRWRFRAVQEGSADLELEYRRSWEARAAESFKVAVRVRPR